METLLVLLYIGAHAAAVVDVWRSRLSRGARVLWAVTLVFLPGLGLAAWLLTRHTAYQPGPSPAGPEE